MIRTPPAPYFANARSVGLLILSTILAELEQQQLSRGHHSTITLHACLSAMVPLFFCYYMLCLPRFGNLHLEIQKMIQPFLYVFSQYRCLHHCCLPDLLLAATQKVCHQLNNVLLVYKFGCCMESLGSSNGG